MSDQPNAESGIFITTEKDHGNPQSWEPQSDMSRYCGSVSLVTGTLDWPVDFQSLSANASGDYGRPSVDTNRVQLKRDGTR
jgi:hypothetical protein